MMRVVLLCIACLLVVGGSYLLFGTDGSEVPLEELRQELPALRDVSFERSYADGVLIVEGEVSTLDECEAASATATLASTGAVRVDLTVPPTEGPCLLRASTASFDIELEASEDATLEFLVNGMPARATEL